MIMNIIAAEAITTLLQPDRHGHPEEAFTPVSGNQPDQESGGNYINCVKFTVNHFVRINIQPSFSARLQAV